MMLKSNRKNIAIILITGIICYGFFLASLFIPDNTYSLSERRGLKKMPQITGEKIVSGKFMTDFDEYTLDQFPLRDNFRKLKANYSKYVLLQKDNHGLYLKNNYLSKLEYPLNEEKLTRSLTKIDGVYKEYLKNTDCNLYLSIISDKNRFLAPKDYPLMDYEAFENKVTAYLNYADYIEITDLLSLENFYRTDQHWKQETILPVAERLSQKMNTELNTDFSKITLENPFYGTYYGQAALSVKPDEIKYLTNTEIENCIVTSYNTGKPESSFMYNMKKASGRDPYEMFLSGSDALITIENPACKNDRELIVFRDSFGSSLIPLLASGYSKITLVDLRYIQSALLKKYISFTNQDVLFLYSTLILNSGL